ncbi:MAG: redoxin domain-containing protein [Steroidobacter sp.]
MSQPKKLGLLTLGIAAVAAPAMVWSAAEAASGASLVGSRVDNFMLADQTGMGHELYYYTGRAAIVIVSSSEGDVVSARAAAALANVRDRFKGKNVEFMMLDSAGATTHGKFVGTPGSADIPVLADELQLVGRSLGVKTTAEVFVIDTRTWTVAYHGPIDESFAQKKNSKANLTDALDAVLAGKPAPAAEAAVKGTPIDFPDRDKVSEFARIDYSTEIAPILADKCVVCHTPGGLGPFAMNSYEVVKGFSPMIREVLRTRRMPPYHSDNHGSSWTDDMRPTDAQVKTIVNWIEAGSPRGEGEDPLPEAAKPAPKWPLGEPDVVVQVPAFDVPATGVIDYQDRSIPTHLTEGRWLKATAWANATPVVHHALAGWIPKVDPAGRGFSWNTSLGGYGPGGAPNLTPEDTGIYVPPGGSYAYQMHYTPIGKPTTDTTEVGYYFYKEQPKYILRQASITDFSIEIPPGKERHHETAYLEFPHDAEIFGVQPHCHSRCYSTKLRIRYPDGAEKVLLNQPRYYFGWQREYHFRDLLEVPKGSLLIADYVYDNSTANAANPDPKKNVTFGEQTSEEMLFTFARFRFKGETTTERHDEWFGQLQANVTFGALDDNIDGKLTRAEFRNDPRFKPVVGYLPMVDADKDGALSKPEMTAALQMLRKMREQRAAPAAPKEDAGAAAMRQNATGESDQTTNSPGR